MLRDLTVRNFRNIQDLSLSPSPRINQILGDNGAGKSSLLEAVDFLSRGRTFRTRLTRALIREDSGGLSVSATLEGGRNLGAERRGKPGEISVENRLGGEAAQTQAEMAAALPVLVFCADLQKQAGSETKHWRNLLDWGVFHVKPAFRKAWQDYRRALRQRNTLLRTPHPGASLRQWEQLMAEQAETMDALRSEYAEHLIGRASASAAEQAFSLDIRYTRGWPEDADFAQVLREAETEDRQAGYTRCGPHRASLRLSWEGEPLSQRASRGQQKAAAALLLLVQVRLFVELSGLGRCVVLIDDLAAEFDEDRRNWMLEELVKTEQQVFVTATQDDPGLPVGSEAKRFHMKQGQLSAA